MATPAVNGAIALLYSAVPKLVRKMKEVQDILQKTAKHQESTDCQSRQKSPNNVYGYGSIDIEAAINYAIQKYGTK